MYLLLATDGPAQADDFLAGEPYARAGSLAEVRRTLFTHGLPARAARGLPAGSGGARYRAVPRRSD